MNANMESSSDLCRGPFSATKLWNEIVQEMKTSVSLKRRRWRMKVFDDAFLGSEALDWLHGFLKESPNFGADVTRQQAVQLCTKFLKNGIITDVRGKQYNGMFEDNNHLYRFTDKARYSPYKARRPQKTERPQAPKSEKETTRTVPAQKRTLNTIFQDEATEDWSVSNTVSTPSHGSRYNLRSNLLTIEPSRTPLVNRLNVMSATRGNPRSSVKSTGGVKLRRKNYRRDSLKEVIMNPAAFVAHNRRSLSDKEVDEVWWNIATNRLKRLMDLDDSVLKFLKDDGYDISCVHRSSITQEFPKAADVLPQWLIPAMKCLIHWPNGDYSKQSIPMYAGFEKDVFKAVVEFFDEEPKSPLVPKHLLPVFKKIVDYLFKCKLTAMRSLQYCCLMIPVRNRDVLQVLLEFMVRLLDNHALSLSDDLPTKEKLIQCFSHAIFGVTADMDVIRLFYFMLEKFPEYFKNPEGLQFQVEQRLLFLRNCRDKKVTVPSKALPPVKSYCERVTPQEFKEQSLITSQRSLKDLLDKIINDESISTKDRKRQLKQFEKTYPEIYKTRFPGDNLSTCSAVSQRSEKLKQVMKPLTILKNLR